MRAFIAAELPASIRSPIDDVIADLRGAPGSEHVRWVPSASIHLTLKFLGEISQSSQELLTTVMAREAARYEPFEVEVAGLGCYPNPRKPRILWIGLAAPSTLVSLQHELDAAASRLGYPSEEREFSPHLTIGRVQQSATAAGLQAIRDHLLHKPVGKLGTIRLEAIHLFKSVLQPAGPVYTRLFTAPLRKVSKAE
jgi:2'-5' RNA ligase